MATPSHHSYNIRNQISVNSYLDSLFQSYAKILPVRIDLGYRTNKTIAESNNEFNYLNNPSLPPHSYLTQEQIVANWNVFLNQLRWNHRTLLKELIGYIWKIEYGVDKGIHYHIMLLFNGNKVQKDYYYADKLGQLWLAITDGLGAYFNCSVDKQIRYGDDNCLKVTHRRDNRDNLYKTVGYLAKNDYYEDMARSFSSGRIFGKGVTS